MIDMRSERTAVLIDGSNLYNATRNLGFDMDYRELLAYLQEDTNLVRACYYAIIVENEEYTPLKPLTDWLTYNGYIVVAKTGKEINDAATGRRSVRGDMNVEITVDMMRLAPRIDHLVLFAGDESYRAAVEALQLQGIRVTVVSSLKAQPPTISNELRRQADQFVDLAEILAERPEIEKQRQEPRNSRE